MNEAVCSNAEDIVYLAVDSQSEKSGIGTKLMLAAMKKTKELGKRYLTLEYITVDNHIYAGETREEIKQKINKRATFYENIAKKLGIPKGNYFDYIAIDGRVHEFCYYDLERFDPCLQISSTLHKNGGLQWLADRILTKKLPSICCQIAYIYTNFRPSLCSKF